MDHLFWFLLSEYLTELSSTFKLLSKFANCFKFTVNHHWGEKYWNEPRYQLKWTSLSIEMNLAISWNEPRYQLKGTSLSIEMNLAINWNEPYYQLKWNSLSILAHETYSWWHCSNSINSTWNVISFIRFYQNNFIFLYIHFLSQKWLFTKYPRFFIA